MLEYVIVKCEMLLDATETVFDVVQSSWESRDRCGVKLRTEYLWFVCVLMMWKQRIEIDYMINLVDTSYYCAETASMLVLSY